MRKMLCKTTIALSMLLPGINKALCGEAANLAKNPDFEEKLTSGGWKPGANVTQSGDEKYKGRHSAKIVAMKPESGQKIRLKSDLIAYSGGPLQVSAWLKAKGVAAGQKSWNVGLFHARFCDKDKKQIGSHSSIGSIKGDTNWLEKKKTYYPLETKKDKWHTIPAGTKYIELGFILSNCTGSMFIDDVKIIGQKAPAAATQTEEKKNNKISKMTAAEKAEYQRLLLATRKPKKNKINYEDNSNLLVMEDVELGPKTTKPLEKFPNMPKMEVRNGGIYLNGKPTLMLGVETHFRLYPFMYKLLGMDYVVLAVSDAANTEVKKLDSRSFEVSWTDYKWLDTMLDTLAQEGLWSYIDFWIGGISVRNKFPDMAIQDPPQHFIHLRMTSPATRRYLNNFSKSVAKITRNYPVFAYELLNEIMYTSPYHPVNLAMFREKMAKKYRDIKKANKAWGTNFASFAEATPPKKGGVSGTKLNLPKNFSQKLFCEYTEFSEELLAQHILNWKNDFKKYEPDGMVFVQAINGMWSDYGNQGVNPETVIKSEDALGCECGITFVPQPSGAEDIDSIKNMTIRLMTRDVWRSVSPNKPLIDGESPLSVAIPPTPKAFVNLEGAWKFKSYASDKGIRENKRRVDSEDKDPDKSWTKLDYDDASWTSIKVPAMWGKEGFPKTYIGLYRKTFSLPEFKGKLYLAGKRLADYADIYINGQLVWKTKIWSEEFCVNIADKAMPGKENEIAIRIYNKYFEGETYWGGIRGEIEIVKSSAELKPLTPGQMRSYLWTCAVHGYSATTITYFYPTEGVDYPFALFNPTYISIEAMKAIPEAKKEIETLAEIVLPRPRIKGKVGLLYPFEAFRHNIAEDAVESLQAPLSKNLLDYYQAFLFSQIPLDMVTSQQILDGRIDKYKALVFRMCDIAKPGIVEKLTAFAEKGGIVIIDHGSLQADSEFYKVLNLEKLTGIKTGKLIYEEKELSFNNMDIPATKTTEPKRDKYRGIEIENISAEIMAKYQDGTPAITVNKMGKGKVFYVGCELPYFTRNVFLKKLMEQNGITPDFQLTGKDKLGSFVEGHAFNKDGRIVWYFNNWGEDCEANVRPDKALPEDTQYRVRDIVSNTTINSPSESKFWTGAELNKGFDFKLPSQNPKLLLVEEKQLAPLERLELSAKHKELLKKSWNKSPESEAKILIDCKRSTLFSKIRTASLVWLLEENGFQMVNSVGRIGNEIKVCNKDVIGKELLSTFNVLSLPGVPGLGGTRGFSDEEFEAIERYVHNGGGLFLSGQFMRGPHGHMSSAYASKVAQLFGVKILRDAIADPEHHIMGDPRMVTFTDIKESPLTKGVKKLQSMGMAPLVISSKNAKATIISDSSAHASMSKKLKGALPAMATVEYGKGRVVIMGDASWMQPSMLDKADNAQLALNIYNWLAKRPTKAIERKALLKTIDATLK